MIDKRFLWNVEPIALAENIISLPKCRITVLTDRLLRLEYSQSGEFTDSASQSVFYRNFPACRYTIEKNDELLVLETTELRLEYRIGAEFSRKTLSIRLKNEPASHWNYGENAETLGGTTQTLDGVNDYIPLGDGLCSRNGYALLDDSETMLLNDDGFIKPRSGSNIDIYFFGYGYNYRECIKDYYRLTGVPPLLPAYALGNWWSRYYAYTQEEYETLIERFEEEDIPISVAVVDMDWHIVDVPNDKKPPESEFERQSELRDGWTGYTWNENLFPDYKKFLSFLHNHNEKVALNLHPAGGVCPHEVQYEAMAKAMGIDPKTKERVRFDVLSPKFMANYFDILHHPYEKDGVDFWWMDWQQGRDYRWIHEANKNGEYRDEREKLDPLWMLNHLHILDISRNGKRPMFFSRYAGPGSQRYPIGFSGDTIATWDALKFQPYFTATASNIGYGWWSHDIGGHAGYTDEEMLTRWIQLGIFSPILRIHSGQSDFLHKEPWLFSDEYRKTVIDSLRLRYRLFPYLYTMNYRCHTELLQLIEPMYYEYPRCNEAYCVPGQFMFGSELLVSAISEKRNSDTKLSETDVWLPQGDWFDFFNGLHYHSENDHNKFKAFRPIERYPVFAKAGAIVPLMEQPPHEHRCKTSEITDILVFPGKSNSFTLYEDEGEGFEYRNGRCCKTTMTLDWNESAADFVIHPACGDTSVLPQNRIWRIMLRGFNRSVCCKLIVNGREMKTDLRYCEDTNTAIIEISARVTDEITVKITGDTLIHDNCDWVKRCEDILLLSDMFISDKHKIINAITDTKETIHNRISKLFCEAPAYYKTILALREILTLTEGEYK